MNIIFLGPPGSGKGTQARKLAEEKDFLHLSTGQMLRDMQAEMPELKKIMDKGDLVDDDLLMNSLYEYLEKNNLKDKVIIDGSPRTLYQYENMIEWFKKNISPIEKVIFIKISEEEAVRRLSSRRTDKNTGIVYNLVTNPPPSGVKPEDLVQRADDNPESIKERYQVYHESTEPVVQAARKDGILHEIDGERPIDEIFEDIKALFK